MLLPEHDFLKPRTLAEGLALLRDATGEVRLLGGGTDVVFNMRCRLMTPDTLLSLKDLSELQGVGALPDGSLRLGASAPPRVSRISLPRQSCRNATRHW